MTESRILWLALGVFVGFVIWGERRHHGGMAQVIDVSDSGTGDVPVSDQSGFAPASCKGSC